MGSQIEINDTLQITAEQGFPANALNLKRHRRKPVKLEDVAGEVFEFHDKSGARVYHTPPTRNFLVHNIDGKWLYWGKILMVEQTIKIGEDDRKTTSGKYKIIDIYEPEYQRQITKRESPKGKSYF